MFKFSKTSCILLITIISFTFSEACLAISTTTVGANAYKGSEEGVKAISKLSNPHGLIRDSSGNLYIVNNTAHNISKITSQGFLTILAGTGTAGFADANARAASFSSPKFIAFAADGNLLVTDTANHRIRKINLTTGGVTTIAGNGASGFTDGPALQARLKSPSGIAVDSQGNIYIADSANFRIRKISSDFSTITTIAGTGQSGFVEGPALTARFNTTEAIALINDNELLVVDSGNRRIRKITNLNSSPTVSTIAGDGTNNNFDGPALSASFASPKGIAVAADGSIYVTGTGSEKLRKISGSTVTTVTGSVAGYADGDGNTALFSNPIGIFIDSLGMIYLADSGNHAIRKIDLNANFTVPPVTTIAGNNTSTAVDGIFGVGTMKAPRGMVYNTNGDLFIADSSNHRIRKLAKSGTLITYAGLVSGFADGNISVARFNTPTDLAIDTSGNLYIADYGNHRIRKIDTAGNVSTIAGSGVGGYADAVGVLAQFKNPAGIAVDTSGIVYVGDYTNNRIRRIAVDGTVTTIGGGSSAGLLDGAAAVSRFNKPGDVEVSSLGIVYVADRINNAIRKIEFNGTEWISSTLNVSATQGYKDGSLSVTLFDDPADIALAPDGTIYIADKGNNRIRKIDLVESKSSTVLGSGLNGFADLDFTDSGFSAPEAIVFDASGNLTIADSGNNRVRKAFLNLGSYTNQPEQNTVSDYIVSTVSGLLGSSGFKDGAASIAYFNRPSGLAIDSNGNIFVADRANNRIRKISKEGLATTFAGSGVAALTNAAGILASFSAPTDVVIDSNDNLFVADYGNHVIRKISPAGVVSTFAGTGVLGDVLGPGISAQFKNPSSLAIDSSDNLYLSDYGNNKIKKINPSGEVTLIAGTGTAGFVDGPAASARFNKPDGLEIDSSGVIYIADSTNHRIRKIQNEIVSTLAGGGSATFADGLGTNALFNTPTDIEIDSQGNLYVADSMNNKIRKVSQDGLVTSFAGTGLLGYEDGKANNAVFNNPKALAMDGSGVIYIAEDSGHKIRKIALEEKITPLPSAPIIITPSNRVPYVTLMNDIDFDSLNTFAIRQGAKLLLKAFAFDYEDGSNIEKSLTWTSSLAGSLTAATSIFDTGTLEAGKHDIVIKAVDSGALVAQASFTINVIANDVDLGDGQGGGADRNGDGVIDDSDKLITPQDEQDVLVKIVSPKKTIKPRLSSKNKLRAYAIDLSSDDKTDLSKQIVWERVDAGTESIATVESGLREFITQGNIIKLTLLGIGNHTLFARVGDAEESIKVEVTQKYIKVTNPEGI